MTPKLLALAAAALLVEQGAALLNELVRPGRKKHEPASVGPSPTSALVVASESDSNSSSSPSVESQRSSLTVRTPRRAYAPAIVCGMTTPIIGASPGASISTTAGLTLETCLQSCVDDSACDAVIYHDAGNCHKLARAYDPLYTYASTYTSYVSNKLAGANCESSYDFLFDGCPRATGMTATPRSSSLTIWECQAQCDSYSDCVAFETNGCLSSPNCGTNCYTFHGGDAGSIYNDGCVTTGDQKSYVKVNYCVRITTGTAGHAGGVLDVTVDGVVEASGSHNTLGAVVLEKCYATEPIVTVRNSHYNNAWVGAIEISTATGGSSSYFPMICIDCTSGTDASDIAVDGDADTSASATCLNQATCTLIASTPSPTASPTASPTTASPSAAPTASPTTFSPTASPTTAKPAEATSVDLIGDPHVTNFAGKRFDIQYVGDLMLLQIPKGAEANATLLRLDGHIKHVGAVCDRQLYLDSVKLSGKWVLDRNGADLFIAVRKHSADVTDRRHKQRFHLGGVHIVMSHARTDTGITYLNLRITNLSQVHAAIGGLLGEDDYSWASGVPPECQASAKASRRAAAAGSVLFASSHSEPAQNL